MCDGHRATCYGSKYYADMNDNAIYIGFMNYQPSLSSRHVRGRVHKRIVEVANPFIENVKEGLPEEVGKKTRKGSDRWRSQPSSAGQ